MGFLYLCGTILVFFIPEHFGFFGEKPTVQSGYLSFLLVERFGHLGQDTFWIDVIHNKYLLKFRL